MANVEWTNKNTLQNLIDTIHARLITKVPHYSVMPTPSIDLFNEICQYIGVTNNDYNNGYFYKCNEIVDPDDGSLSYKWQTVEVQNSTHISAETDNAITELADGLYAKAVQVSELGVADSTKENIIYQYIGETDEDYTNGYFYKCTYDSENDSYSWTSISTQKEDIPHWIGTKAELEVAINAGEIEEGTIILITDDPDVDDVPTEDSTNLVYSGGVWSALQAKQDIMQLETMPTASADYDGEVVEFVGARTANYMHGYFYECVHDTSNNTYSWQAVATMDSVGRKTAGVVGAEYFNSYEGAYVNKATGQYSHAEGLSTEASNNFSHAEGYQTTANGAGSHAEGSDTKANGDYSHAEGNGTTASGEHSHAEGISTTALGSCAHAEGYYTTARSDYTHAEGDYTEANGKYTHAEGSGTKANGDYSHAEGKQTTATGANSHAEGDSTEAGGQTSHAEGARTKAPGAYSHAEGCSTIAAGGNSHAEGYGSIATGIASHAGGQETIADYDYQTTIGKYNAPKRDDLFEIGNGTGGTTNRSNILEVSSTYLNVNGDIRKDGKSIITQVSTMPTASADNLGSVLQFIGTTTTDYTQGDYYICSTVADSDPAEYEWVKLTYNKDEVDSIVSAAGHFEAVDSLPTTDIKTNTIYLVPKLEDISGYLDSSVTPHILYVGNGSSCFKYVQNDTVSPERYEAQGVITHPEPLQAIKDNIENGTYTAATVKRVSTANGNVKDEYINLDGTSAGWEKIGDTEIDLSNYVTHDEVVAITQAELTAMWAD